MFIESNIGVYLLTYRAQNYVESSAFGLFSGCCFGVQVSCKACRGFGFRDRVCQGLGSSGLKGHKTLQFTYMFQVAILISEAEPYA